MSIKNILGLTETGLTDYEIMAKIREARRKNLNEVDFISVDGSVIKLFIPLIPNFDIYMDIGS
ncbi:hypothetical protein KY331_00640 [Candidatus Woesearchaeota archaeon]|nr:hypothetical protein [Candidatus Woesearchaeota archaeon]